MLLLFTNQHIEFFLQLLKCIYVKAPCHCPTIVIGDFNVDMLENISSLQKLKDYMQQHKFILTFLERITIHNSQLDNVWSNSILTTCQSRITKTYWTIHKLIYFMFKLPSHVTRFFFPNKNA
jgi:hypothetical protein